MLRIPAPTSKLRALIDRAAEALARGEIDLVRDLLGAAKQMLAEIGKIPENPGGRAEARRETDE